jgi:hypothetical protein
MIPDREEVLRSLYGAWRLARADVTGMQHFNLSVEGFWRSFFAAIIVAPGYALLVVQRTLDREEGYDPGSIVVVESIAYLAAWAAFPLVAVVLTQLLGLGRHYVELIVAVNWSAVLQVAAFLAAMALGLLLPEGFAALLLAIVTGALMLYQWFVMRTALQTTGGVALVLVLVDLLLSTVINLSADRLL